MELEKYPEDVLDHRNQASVSRMLELPWMKFKIVVSSEEDAERMRAALRYLHDSDIDTDYIWVNQLVHAYEPSEGTIIVNPIIAKS